MNTFEKIAAAVIGILLIGTVILSYHEFTEAPGSDKVKEGPNFEHSVGQDLKIGPFSTILSKSSSGGLESVCKPLQPAILATLHDVDQHLEQMGVYTPGVFEVNQETLDLLCNTNAQITLSDEHGNKLLLEKVPFVRVTPSGATGDIGTDIKINATVIMPGSVPPLAPTTYGEEMILDHLLDTATSSGL